MEYFQSTKSHFEFLTVLSYLSSRSICTYLGNVRDIVVSGMVLVVFRTRLTIGRRRVVLSLLAFFALIFSWSSGSVEILHKTLIA